MSNSTGPVAEAQPPERPVRRRRVRVLAWRLALGVAYGVGAFIAASAGDWLIWFVRR
ncbi:hypothetical protein PUR57_33315 [Streptomyces sp. JV176]|uniref:hypothetical protein n=1 Tax=Streptomyces sp. JV176 TaxID=858630 RepID=UPI002E788241|nr:hypothetical protein [Streptomyces sp. JV176]MEE1803493.1 hypothetical protein [Streptomyces sp. JV176]